MILSFAFLGGMILLLIAIYALVSRYVDDPTTEYDDHDDTP